MYRGIPNAELAVLPGARYGDLGEVPNELVINFLKRYLMPTASIQTVSTPGYKVVARHG